MTLSVPGILVFQKCAKEEIMKQIPVMLLTGCLLALLGGAGALAGTDDKSVTGDATLQVTGTYVNVMASNVRIELKTDGTYSDRFGKRSSQGKYVVKGNKVVFTSGAGKTFEFVIEGDSLMSKEGARFKRQ